MTENAAKKTIIIDASGAKKGAEDFERAAGQVKAAAERASASADRMAKASEALGRAEDRAAKATEAAARAATKYGADSEKAAAAAQRAERAQASLANAQGRLAVAQERAALSSERLQIGLSNQASRLNALERAYDPVSASAQKLARDQEYLNGIIERGGQHADRARAILAALTRETGPAAEASRKQAAALAETVRSQEMASATAKQQAASVGQLRASLDSGYAAQIKYSSAVNDLTGLYMAGAVNGRQFASMMAQIDAQLNPATLAAQKQKAAIQALEDRLNPAAAAVRRLAADQGLLNKALASGTIDSGSHAALTKSLQAQSAAARAQADAVSKAAATADALRMAYDATYASQARYAAEMNKLNGAFMAGAVNGRQYADMAARIREALDPAALAARASAAATAKQAQAADQMRASLDSGYAAQLKHSSAINELTSLYMAGAVNGRQFAAMMAQIDAQLNPATIAAQKQQTALRALEDRLLPAGAAARQLAADQALLNNALASGKIDATKHAALTRELLAQSAAGRTAAATAAQQAQGVDRMRASLDSGYAAQVKYSSAVNELTGYYMSGTINGRQYTAMMTQLNAQLNPAALAAQKQRAAIQALEDRLNPAAAAARRFAADQDLLTRAIAKGGEQANRARALLAELQKQQQAATGGWGAYGSALGRAMSSANLGGLSALPGQIGGATSAFGGMGLAATAAGVAVVGVVASVGMMAREAIRAGDQMTAALGKLSVGTGSMDGAREVYQELYELSLKTGISVGESAGQFTRFAIAAKQIGATRDEVIQLVATVQKFGVASGISTQEAQAGAMQLGQALASGRLQGDELRSILENMPLLATALARELGVTVGQLREMGQKGELAVGKVFSAILRSGAEADRLFDQMPITVTQASSIAANAWDRFSAEIDRSLGISEKLKASLLNIAGTLDGLAGRIAGQTATAAKATVQGRINELRSEIAAIQAVTKSHEDAAGGRSAYADRFRDIHEAPKAEKLRTLEAELEALGEVARREGQIAAERRRNEKIVAQQTKLEAEKTRATTEYKEALKGLHPQVEALEKRKAALAKVEAAEQKGVIDATQAAKDRAAIEKRYQEDLKKGEKSRTSGLKAIENATRSVKLEAAAAERLAAAAGLGEAAIRRATAQNEIAAAVAKGVARSTAEAAEATKEYAAVLKIRSEFAAGIDKEVTANTRMAAAIAQGGEAVRAAEVYTAAYAQTLREVPYPKAGEDVTAWNKALAENVDLVERQRQSTEDVGLAKYAADVKEATEALLVQQRLIGANPQQSARIKAEAEVAKYLRQQNTDMSKLTEAQKQSLATTQRQVESNELLSADIERRKAAFDAVGKSLEQAFDRVGDALVDAFVKGEAKAIDFGSITRGILASLMTDMIKMGALNVFKNSVLGTNEPTLWDLGSSGQSGGNGLTNQAMRMGMDKASGWLGDKFGINANTTLFSTGTGWAMSAPASVTGAGLVGPVAPITTAGSANAATGIATAGNTAAANTLYTGSASGVSGGSFTAGMLGSAFTAGSIGGMLGSWAGTKTNSKAVGGLTGAAGGAIASMALAGSIVPGIGTAIGAVIGAIMAMIGTQKATSGPNQAGMVNVSSNGFALGRYSQDNKGDIDAAKEMGTAASAYLNTIFSAIGATLDVQADREISALHAFQRDGKVRSVVQDVEEEFSSVDEAMADMARRTIEALDSYGEINGLTEDVRTALKNSKAIDATEFAKHLAWAADFQTVVNTINNELSFENEARTAGVEAAKAMNAQIAEFAKLAGELLPERVGEADAALRRLIDGIIDGTEIEPPSALQAAVTQAEAYLNGLTPSLIKVGYTADEAASRIEEGYLRAVEEIIESGQYSAREINKFTASMSSVPSVVAAANRAIGTLVSGLSDNVRAAMYEAAGMVVPTALLLKNAGVPDALKGMVGGAVNSADYDFARATADLARLDEQLSRGAISADEYQLAAGFLTQALQRATEAAKSDAAATKQLADERARAAEQAKRAAELTTELAAKLYEGVGLARTASLIRFDASAAKEREEALGLGVSMALFGQVKALERAQLEYDLLTADLEKAYQAQYGELAEQTELLRSISTGFREMAASLKLDTAVSPLLASQRMDEARSQMTAAEATLRDPNAALADKSAAAQLIQSLSKTYLEASVQRYGQATGAHQAEWSGMIGHLESLSSEFSVLADTDLQQLTVLTELRDQAAAMGAAQLGSVEDLTAQTTGAFAKLQDLVRTIGLGQGGTVADAIMAAEAREKMLRDEAKKYGVATDMEWNDFKAPSLAELMQKTGLSNTDASALLYGVRGSNRETRDWEALMASGSGTALVDAIRAANFEMLNSPDRRNNGILKGEDVIGGRSGNWAAIKDESNPLGYVIALLDAAGNIQRTIDSGTAGSYLDTAWQYGIPKEQFAGLATFLDEAGLASRPGQRYAGSDHGVDFANLAVGGTGGRNWWYDPNGLSKDNPDKSGLTPGSNYNQWGQGVIDKTGVDTSAAGREAAYLAANPDVAAAVKAGLFASGVSHWVQFGQAEGRAYEDGGIVGNGLWGKDSVLARFAGGGHIALAGGEGVLTAASTAAIGGASTIDYINRHGALPSMPRLSLPTLPAMRPQGAPANTDLSEVTRRLDTITTKLSTLVSVEASSGDGVINRLEKLVDVVVDGQKSDKLAQSRRI